MTQGTPKDIKSAIKNGLEELLTTCQPGQYDLDKWAETLLPYIQDRIAQDAQYAEAMGETPVDMFNRIFKRGEK